MRTTVKIDLKKLTLTLKSLTLSKEIFVGFVDTLPYLRQKYPELHNHCQNKMSRIRLNKDCNAHHALNDVLVLHELIFHENISIESCLKWSFPLSYVDDSLTYFHRRKQYLVTLSPLHVSDVTSKSMLAKIDGSGLALDDITKVYKHGGFDGVTLLLSEKGKNRKPSVTNRTQILEKIS